MNISVALTDNANKRKTHILDVNDIQSAHSGNLKKDGTVVRMYSGEKYTVSETATEVKTRIDVAIVNAHYKR